MDNQFNFSSIVKKVDLNLAFFRELNCVFKQIDQHLPKAFFVTIQFGQLIVLLSINGRDIFGQSVRLDWRTQTVNIVGDQLDFLSLNQWGKYSVQLADYLIWIEYFLD